MSRSNPSTAVRNRALVFASGLILASLACQVNLGGPQSPGDPIQTSSQDAEALQKQWADALAQAGPKEDIRLKIDEAQLSSFLALRFQQRANLGIESPQVFLRQDEIRFFATLDRGILRANVLMGIAPTIDPDGNLSFEVTSADFGPVPMPDVLKSSLSAAISEAFAGSLGSLATGIDIKSVEISDGEMTLTGRFR